MLAQEDAEPCSRVRHERSGRATCPIPRGLSHGSGPILLSQKVAAKGCPVGIFQSALGPGARMPLESDSEDETEQLQYKGAREWARAAASARCFTPAPGRACLAVACCVLVLASDTLSPFLCASAPAQSSFWAMAPLERVRPQRKRPRMRAAACVCAERVWLVLVAGRVQLPRAQLGPR